MTEAATAAPVEEAPATTATPTGDTTAVAEGTSKTSATDAANERPASAGQTGSTETEDVPELTALTKEQRKTLGEQLKKLDPEARKVYNQILDGKFQETAAERKQREAAEAKATELKAYADIIDKIEEDPEGTISQLQARFIKPKPGAKVEVSDEEVRAIEASLDEATKPLAKVIAPALRVLLDERLKPIEEREKAAQAKAQEASALSAIEAFAKEAPDWEQFKPQMLAIGDKLGLAKSGLAPGEILRITYTLASSEAKQKAAMKTSAEKILEKVARAAENAEPDTTSVSGARVASKPPASVREAWVQAREALARGETVED